MSASSHRVYTSYDLDALPKHPGNPWTRFVCISDTHSRTRLVVPPGDVLIHAGDLSRWGTLSYLQITLDWLRGLPHKVKIIIAGNHDLCLDYKWAGDIRIGLDPKEMDAAQELVRSEAMRQAGILYLDHQNIEVGLPDGIKWKVYGSPAAPLYASGAFQYASEEEAIEEWSQIPRDVDILITHTPPFGVLDKTRHGKLAGCRTLASRINSLSNCRLHVFGHIHEAHGVNIAKRIVSEPNREPHQVDFISVNAACYSSEMPIIVDIKKDA
ncbi:hypothetical protein ACEPAI_5028 [Sanghuangporus weigelae]